MTVLRIGEPRRHLPGHHGGLYRLRPRPSICICQQGHRRHFAGTVASLAVLLQDGKNVLIECHGLEGSAAAIDAVPSRKPMKYFLSFVTFFARITLSLRLREKIRQTHVRTKPYAGTAGGTLVMPAHSIQQWNALGRRGLRHRLQERINVRQFLVGDHLLV